jgi:hypothetical protein
MINQYNSKDEWYAALLAIAKSHCVEHLVADKEEWTENWEKFSPESEFYGELPEFYEVDDPLCR